MSQLFTELGTESPPPYYLNESMLCSSFGEGCDTDYDLDEEDAEFLVEKRRVDPTFTVTESMVRPKISRFSRMDNIIC